MNSSIIPAPPNLAGLAWREISRDDLTALAGLASACFVADGGLHFMFEPDSISSRCFPEAPGVAIGAFATDGYLVASATVHLSGESGSQKATIMGQVRPDLRNRGIGTTLMRWSQAEALALLASASASQRVLQISTESLTEPAHRLYLAHGFQSVAESLVMRRDLQLPLPACPLPPGVTLTTWHPDLVELFFQAYVAAFRERPGFPGYRNAAEWIDSWTTDNFMPEWSLLARAGDVPVGLLTATTNPPHALVMQVGVIPAQRRRGLGSALIVETMRRMQAAGAASSQLVVYTNNPGAIQTYVELGFAVVGRRARYERSA